MATVLIDQREYASLRVVVSISTNTERNKEMKLEQILGLWRERAKWRLHGYMRSHADQYTKQMEDEDQAGPSEVKWLLSGQQSRDGQAFLDELGVKREEEIKEALRKNAEALEKAEDEYEEARGERTRPQQVRERFGLSGLELEMLMQVVGSRLWADVGRLSGVASGRTGEKIGSRYLQDLFREPMDVSVETYHGLRRLVEKRLLVAASEETEGSWRRVDVSQPVLDFMQGLAPRQALTGVTQREALTAEFEMVWGEGMRVALAGPLKARKPVLVVGPAGSGRRHHVQALLGGQGLTVVDMATASRGAPAAPVWADLVRDTQLMGGALLLRLDGLQEPWPDAALVGIEQVLSLADCPVVMTAHEGRLPSLSRAVEVVALELPNTQEQEALWMRLIKGQIERQDAQQQTAALLCANYQLHGAQIVRAFDVVRGGKRARAQELDISVLLDAIRRILEHGLSGLAQVLEGGLSLSSVVLSAEVKQQLQEIQDFARNRQRVLYEWGAAASGHSSAGLSVLFSGAPGTGKTLCAIAIGKALGKVVWRVDLSQIVNKYIGETEKNLGKTFREASKAQAVLLFDEADSLFSKRTEVKSSNDRYANLEVNFLLQRIESFPGICILTTNLADSIDDAFKRRLRFIVNFPVPEERDRALLWERLLPAAAPRAANIDFGQLAKKFSFSGGHIYNATLRATFKAAAQDRPIDLNLLMEAGLHEDRSLGNLVRS
jgi:hypothetical protein